MVDRGLLSDVSVDGGEGNGGDRVTSGDNIRGSDSGSTTVYSDASGEGRTRGVYTGVHGGGGTGGSGDDGGIGGGGLKGNGREGEDDTGEGDRELRGGDVHTRDLLSVDGGDNTATSDGGSVRDNERGEM